MPDDNNIHVTSYNQRGGITAYQVNLQPGDRALNDPVRHSLDQTLKQQSFASIRVTAVIGDQEAFRFASQIKNYLESAGYQVSGVDQAVYTRPIQGQVIEPADDGGMLNIVIGGR